jgi:hypothetical protein
LCPGLRIRPTPFLMAILTRVAPIHTDTLIAVARTHTMEASGTPTRDSTAGTGADGVATDTDVTIGITATVTVADIRTGVLMGIAADMDIEVVMVTGAMLLEAVDTASGEEWAGQEVMPGAWVDLAADASPGAGTPEDSAGATEADIAD